jgi:hypothetical protein
MGTLTYHSAYIKDSKNNQEFPDEAFLALTEED